MEYKDKKVEEILEELKNILNDITKNNSVSSDISKKQEDNIRKVEEIKELLKTKENISENTVQQTKTEHNINMDLQNNIAKEEVKDKKIDATKKEGLLNKGNIIEESVGDKIVYDIKQGIPEKKEEQPAFKQEIQVEQNGKVLLNTMLIYPSLISDAKDIFFNNINSTLKKISKKNVEFVMSTSIAYNSLNIDVLLQYNSILEKIKIFNLNIIILIVNENTFEVEEFLKKISQFVLVAKVITLKELSMKSTYLDFAIDLLLTVK